MSDLLSKIESKTARIGVIGLGYVGLPLAVEFAVGGFQVTGFEIDETKLNLLRAGKNYIQDVDPDQLSQALSSGNLKVESNFSLLREMDCVSICVPTPLRKTKDPDLSFIIESVHQVKKHFHRDMLIVLESTTYPGTTDELILSELQDESFQVGRDFFLAFSPERVDPGNPEFKTVNTPKIIGGITLKCGEIAQALYRNIIDPVVLVSSARTAEMVKLLENTFRAVNIGLVNEMAIMCDHLGVSVWEVIEAAATKPFGFMKFLPGPGLGGHCIPIDPMYLSWKLKSLNYSAHFIELAGDINNHMPDFVIERLGRALNENQKCFNGSRILILGAAYKRDVNDYRESPALRLFQLLQEQKALVEYHDPYIARISVGDETAVSIRLIEDIYRPDQFTERVVEADGAHRTSLKEYDAVLIVADHSCYDANKMLTNISPDSVIFDTRNMMKTIENQNVFRL